MTSNESQYLLRLKILEQDKSAKIEELLSLQARFAEAAEESGLKIARLDAQNRQAEKIQANVLQECKQAIQLTIQEHEASTAEMLSSVDQQYKLLLQSKELEIAMAAEARQVSERVVESQKSEIAVLLTSQKAVVKKNAELEETLSKRAKAEELLRKDYTQVTESNTTLEEKIAELQRKLEECQAEAEAKELKFHAEHEEALGVA